MFNAYEISSQYNCCSSSEVKFMKFGSYIKKLLHRLDLFAIFIIKNDH